MKRLSSDLKAYMNMNNNPLTSPECSITTRKPKFNHRDRCKRWFLLQIGAWQHIFFNKTTTHWQKLLEKKQKTISVLIYIAVMKQHDSYVKRALLCLRGPQRFIGWNKEERNLPSAPIAFNQSAPWCPPRTIPHVSAPRASSSSLLTSCLYVSEPGPLASSRFRLHLTWSQSPSSLLRGPPWGISVVRSAVIKPLGDVKATRQKMTDRSPNSLLLAYHVIMLQHCHHVGFLRYQLLTSSHLFTLIKTAILQRKWLKAVRVNMFQGENACVCSEKGWCSLKL